VRRAECRLLNRRNDKRPQYAAVDGRVIRAGFIFIAHPNTPTGDVDGACEKSGKLASTEKRRGEKNREENILCPLTRTHRVFWSRVEKKSRHSPREDRTAANFGGAQYLCGPRICVLLAHYRGRVL
jgi:hypothetical protein